RASLVNEKTLAEIAEEMGFSDSIRLGKGEALTGGAKKPRLLASAFEAFVGCLYREKGYNEVTPFLESLFEERLNQMDLSVSFETDYKTRLQEKIQEKVKKTPRYFVTDEEGPDHSKTFYIEVRVDDTVLAVGSGKSKKQAEQDAARVALELKSEL
ncbi:MAG: ribonuclease III, partial [Bdellovibrionales bacterium]|nr:ribonuclease III [Bdellovibrionales bacterium]